MYQAFAASGPTDEEMAIVRKQIANTLEEQVKDPAYWMSRLEQLTFRGTALDDVVADPAAYQALTAKQVKEVFAKYDVPESAIVVVVRPEAAPPTDKKAGPGEEPSTGK